MSEISSRSWQQEQVPVCQHILIACIGNIFLGDDGFGVEVAHELSRRPDLCWSEGVQVVDFGIRGLDLAYTLLDGGYDALILVDAIPRGGVPGTLHVLEIPWLNNSYSHGYEDQYRGGVALDAHSMDPVKVLAFASGMGAQPVYTLLVGCEPAMSGGEDDGRSGGYEEMQMELSEPVRKSIGKAIEMLDVLVTSLTRSSSNVSRQWAHKKERRAHP